jgi:hypothetical protein
MPDGAKVHAAPPGPPTSVVAMRGVRRPMMFAS